jgi:pimeloyl-ACP methyl ester carboxylesterase
MAVDFTTSIRELRVPVFFIAGRRDYQTPSKVLEKYFHELQAPIKEIIWFEDSGHFPNIEEPEKYQEFMIDRVLATTFGPAEHATE